LPPLCAHSFSNLAQTQLPDLGALERGEEAEFVDVVHKKTGNKEKKEVGGAWASRKQNRHEKEAAAEVVEEGARKKGLERKDIKHSVTKLSFSPDGKTLVAACRDYFLYVPVCSAAAPPPFPNPAPPPPPTPLSLGTCSTWRRTLRRSPS
jgi:hypothetical protein